MTASKVILSIGSKWRFLIWMKILIGWVIMTGLGYLTFASQLSLGFQGLFVVTTAVISFLLYRDQLPEKEQVEALINAQLPELEYSVSLVNHTPQTSLALLQQQRVIEKLSIQSKNISYPINWGQLLYILLLSGVISLAAAWLSTFQKKSLNSQSTPEKTFITKGNTEILKTSYDLKVIIKSPAYSGIQTI